MTLQELQSAHMGQLAEAFGIANTQAVAKDNKEFRAFGKQG
jgi:hypothetical protein